jgi:8-oxo-dGTP pyrophosphatase MutT (NUDIX family)
MKHQYQYSFCNNCGKHGNHTYSNCRHPVTSIGIIAIRRKPAPVQSIDNVEVGSDTKDAATLPSIQDMTEYEFLMIRRKDTLGFVDFVRGKYQLTDIFHIRNIIDEMTMDEKRRLVTHDFKQLWTEMWGGYTNGQFSGEETQSRDKFNHLKNGLRLRNGSVFYLDNLVKDSATRWERAEWGFPKGRRNNQEGDLFCALRENQEETGYCISQTDVIHNISPYEEIFMGSNLKCYKHKYFLALVNSDIRPTGEYERSEVSKIKWMSYEECVQKIRPYNIEKKKILANVMTVLRKYKIIHTERK